MSPVTFTWSGLKSLLHDRSSSRMDAPWRSSGEPLPSASAALDLSDAVRRFRRYGETLRMLESMTSQDLADIGVRRGDISRIAREAAWRPSPSRA